MNGSNDYEVTFPGGVKVEVHYHGLSVVTDQPPPLGEGTALSPYDLFFASLASCAGFYALRFCQERNISTEGLAVRLGKERDPETKRLVRASLEVTLPDGFPEKYRQAILRAVDQCSVKKALAHPPEIETVLAGVGEVAAV